MRIRSKVFCGFGAIAIIGAFLGLMGLYGERKLTMASTDLLAFSKTGSSLSTILASHHEWRQNLSNAVYIGTAFTGSLDPTTCALGRWLLSEEANNLADPQMLELLHSITETHNHMHNEARTVIDDIAGGNQVAAESHFESRVLSDASVVIAGLEGMQERNDYLLSSGSQGVHDFGSWFGKIIVMAIIAALALSVLLTIFISGKIVKPIADVTLTLKDISEGEGDLTRSIAVKSKDEVGDLAKYFNQTLEKIKNLIVIIKNEGTKLQSIGTALASNMTQTAAAINQITANIQSIKGRVINQSASVTETNATMEQVIANINKLNGHVENQSRNVSQASSAIEESKHVKRSFRSRTQRLAGSRHRHSGNIPRVRRLAGD